MSKASKKGTRMNTGITSIIASLLSGRGKTEEAPDAKEATPVPTPDHGQADQFDPRRYLIEDIATKVAAGFDTRDEIVERSVEAAEDENLDMARDEIDRMVDDAIAAHAAIEATWTGMTDNDRLDAAAKNLEAAGIVFRENFTCCGTCGSAEIWDEIETAKEAGADVRGYAFYHMQDAEGAVDGGGVYLGYGAVERGEDAAVAIGREIEAAMQKQGLSTRWNGSIGRRILVEMEWRRRRPVDQAGAATN
jgi:hypothetical protein